MSDREDILWQKLIGLSAPTYGGNLAVPGGFTARVVSRWQDEMRQYAMIERIGLKALLAALALLLLAEGVHLGVKYMYRQNFDPGMKGFVQVENVPVS